MAHAAATALLVCTGDKVVLPGARDPQPATIAIDTTTGIIIDVQHARSGRSAFPDIPDDQFIDAGDRLILPGLVDAHVHLNEPGRTDWEGFLTGTRAAASGGVTAVVDMPLNSIPPTTTVPNLEAKRAAARGQCYTDVAFWGGVIPGNQSHLKALVDAGVKGFKCFLIESGVEEFPCVQEPDLKVAMAEMQDLPTTLLFHAELDQLPSDQEEHSRSADPTDYQTFLDSRPQRLEANAISLITSLQEQYPSLKCHIVHLSAASALPLIRAAKSKKLPLTVETCFHYLCLSSQDIPKGHPEFKCCPPIREGVNRDALWEALIGGDIDCVVSDHSPCVAELKNLVDGDIMSAWGGISALGLGLSLLWTEGLKRGVTICQIVDWMGVKTAAHANLASTKGQLRVGFDGDFSIWNPDTSFKVTKEGLNFKNKLSPYEGLVLQGRVEKTYLRGHLVYDAVQGFEGIQPSGKLL
ncbi:hypothetical protein CCMSSC00406_0005449 [Pleurotus cornucopiae]|uniref:Uncharacterized protein n=1 Tax=Pleurotus cornucopiae TaxID=5321 RepID=A0ACB7IS73_PLECO|nr:hypothetical protein CCMSSC00406_0005449 [Pleurotus cornucopiae]